MVCIVSEEGREKGGARVGGRETDRKGQEGEKIGEGRFYFYTLAPDLDILDQLSF